MATTIDSISRIVQRMAATFFPPSWSVDVRHALDDALEIRVIRHTGPELRPQVRYVIQHVSMEAIRSCEGQPGRSIDMWQSILLSMRKELERPRCCLFDHEDCQKSDELAQACIRERLIRPCPHEEGTFRYACQRCMNEEDSGIIPTTLDPTHNEPFRP